MGPKPRITLENRAKAVALSEEGYSQRQIADRLGCSQKSIDRTLRRHSATGSVQDKTIPGRRRKTSRRENSLIVRKSKADRFKTAPQIKAELQIEHGVQVSASTIQRRLREVGLLARKPCRKPHLTLCHKRARLQFSRVHRNWMQMQWSHVIFSDESKFMIHRSDGRVYVRRMASEEFSDRCAQKIVKHGGGGIMMWGCITANGVGLLWRV